MRKVTVAVLGLALAGTAGADGWRSLRLDGSGEDGFSRSVAAFQEELSPARRYVFERALQDIWVKGTEDAEAEQREYTATEYFRQLDGLRYKDVVRFIDPTGKTAATRYRNAYALLTPRRPPQVVRPPPQQPGFVGFSGERVRGIDNQAQALHRRSQGLQ